jgi:hypothetical protein
VKPIGRDDRDLEPDVAQERLKSHDGQPINSAMEGAQIPTPRAGTVACARCSARWGGLKTAHCTVCHATFTVVAAFDKHRAGSHERDERRCLDSSAVGLVDPGRAYRCWGFPGRDEADGDS